MGKLTKCELKVKTPLNAVEKWCELDQKISNQNKLLI